IEASDDDLVQTGAVPDDAGCGILRIGEGLLCADLEIFGCDRLARTLAERDDQPIVLPRWRRLLAVGCREARQADTDCDELEQASAPAGARWPPRNGGLGHWRHRSLGTAAIVRARR